VKLMNHYIYVTGKILSLLWHYINEDEDEPYHPTLLELPDFQKLARLSLEKKKAMIKDVCMIVSNVYDFEWWWIVKQKTKQYVANHPDSARSCQMGGAEKFPTTMQELTKYVRNKPQIRINCGSKVRNITTVGKCDYLTLLISYLCNSW
jgi:hypothetical protein